MSELKKLSPAGIDAALAKAEHYRLLNEPAEADSICRDVLAVDPGNRRAHITLVLALSDRIGEEGGGVVAEAVRLLGELDGDYERAYYEGILHERHAKALLRRGAPGSGGEAYNQLRRAMECFERAERVRPPDNDDAILRWNTCVRIIDRFPHVRHVPEERVEHGLE